MLGYLKQEADLTQTENGAATYCSTGSYCLDLFATVGALRKADDTEIIARFIRAYAEDPDMAMKLLFFARDIRGGLGERRVFRTILHWLAAEKPESVRKNLAFIEEYGRFDDLLALLDTPCEADMLRHIKARFDADRQVPEGEPVSLLGKWLPSINTSNAETVRAAKRIAKAFGLSDAAYRKALVALRARIRILENNLREKDYTFDYEKQPSRAMFKYRKAFARNDGERYSAFLDAVKSGSAVLHTENVAPYELVAPFLSFDWQENGKTFMRSVSQAEKDTLNATWASLPDFGSGENALAVVDTSGSMYCDGGLPAAVALSLGLYFAERNTGCFANRFIEFSERPQLIELKGETFADRLRYAASFCEVANTNLEAVFDLILRAAVRYGATQSELPKKLIIISDMEFDMCVGNASAVNFAHAEKKFAAQGYTLPEVVFWNAKSRNCQQPVKMNAAGVTLVSGVTPRIFSMVAGDLTTPYEWMKEVLGSERYVKIAA